MIKSRMPRTVAETAHFPRSSGRARSPEPKETDRLLALQRSIGNQALLRLMARPDRRLGSVRVRRERRIEADDVTRSSMLLADAVQNQAGIPLPKQLERNWGLRLGRDLSSIRTHANQSVGEAVRRSGANAVSYGSQILFAPGRYDTGTFSGLSLLGHELVHCLQTRRAAAPARGSGWIRSNHDSVLEAEADREGTRLAESGGDVVRIRHEGRRPAFRGDKKIVFTGRHITVSDTYVLYGAGLSPVFLERFRQALDEYYNSPRFNHRGYTVKFNLSVRQARYRTRTVPPPSPHRNMELRGTIVLTDMVDSGMDDDTMLMEVETGTGTAGGFPFITVYETSTKGIIAHEVGHYLSDRVGWFSEGYDEGLYSRVFGAILGIVDRETGIKPGAEGDIMASLSGVVGDFSLTGILDNAIAEHEAELARQRQSERASEEFDTAVRALEGDTDAQVWFIRRLSGL